jgi:GxxExxY protein
MAKIETPYDTLTYQIIGLAMKVHTELGPGFPEEIYKRAMIFALTNDNLSFNRELKIELSYDGKAIGDFKLDLLVEQTVIVELKAVESLHPIHERQVISYLAATGLSVGLLVNFGAVSLQHKRIFPPQAVQSSSAFQARTAKFLKSVPSDKSVDESSYLSSNQP